MLGADVGGLPLGRLGQLSADRAGKIQVNFHRVVWLNEKPRGREQMPHPRGVELTEGDGSIRSSSFGSAP